MHPSNTMTESVKGILSPRCWQCPARPPTPCFLLALCAATQAPAHRQGEALSEALCAEPQGRCSVVHLSLTGHLIRCPQNYGASFTPLRTRESSSQRFGALHKNPIALGVGQDLNPSHSIPSLMFFPPCYSYGGEFRKPSKVAGNLKTLSWSSKQSWGLISECLLFRCKLQLRQRKWFADAISVVRDVPWAARSVMCRVSVASVRGRVRVS